MSQQGPILVVSTAKQPSFAATIDIGRLFPVVETEWADAVRAVEQVQPAAVLAATSDTDAAGPADPASGQRHSLLPEPDPANSGLADPRRDRPSAGPPARRAARAVVACDRD